MFGKKKQLEFDQITTRGGDQGNSFLYSGEKKWKSDDVFEVLGDLDELNSYLGVVRNLDLKYNNIPSIQRDILNLSAQIATNPSSEIYESLKKITDNDIYRIEDLQRKLMSKVEISPNFILPGEIKGYTAHIDVSRTTCRRSERHLVGLIRDSSRRDLYDGQVYLNRLSDYLFVLSRFEDSLK